MKTVKTIQRFEYTRAGEARRYLLMPGEARSIAESLDSGKPMIEVFGWWTGYSAESVENVRLIIEWVEVPNE